MTVSKYTLQGPGQLFMDHRVLHEALYSACSRMHSRQHGRKKQKLRSIKTIKCFAIKLKKSERELSTECVTVYRIVLNRLLCTCTRPIAIARVFFYHWRTKSDRVTRYMLRARYELRSIWLGLQLILSLCECEVIT